MRYTFLMPLAITVATLFMSTPAFTADGGLPGDHGRPGNGIPPPPQEPASQAGAKQVPAPDIAVAVSAAQAVAHECQQYALSVAVVNAAGEPILVYVGKGSSPGHGYMAVRKAYSAIVFKDSSSALKEKVTQDPKAAAQFASDPNLVAYPGGILWRRGDQVIGAVGVAGAYAGNHESLDEACAVAGLAQVNVQSK